jgi:DNA end-binding protein Ku
MPARAAWKGYLKLSQLTLPVKAFTATRSDEEIQLNQLHRDCGQKIRQIKLCPTHGEVATEAIQSGYKLDDQRYLPLADEELDALRPPDDKAIQVEAFVPGDSVDAVYHSGRTYYLVPDAPPGQRPFCVLRDGMQSTGRYALARIVVSRRELLVLLRPLGRLVAMTVLEYAQRVRPAADYESEVAGLSASPAELQLMGTLIESLGQSDPDLARYRDRYIDGLDALIANRMASMAAEQETGLNADSADPSQSNVGDDQLVAALRASLAAAGVDPSAPAPALLPSLSRRLDVATEQRDRKTG